MKVGKAKADNRATWIRVAVLASAVGALEIACRVGWVPATMVIAPSAMVKALIETLQSDDIGAHLQQTLSAVAIAMGLSIVGGFLIGFVLHWVPFLRRAFNPFLAAYYAIPHFAFYPLLIVIFGLGPAPLIVLATLFAMVAMIVATMAGLDRVPRVLLKTARMHRLSLLEEIWRIRLPAAAPHLLSGVKLAVAYSFIGVIAGEFILSTSGIGHEIAYAYDNFDNPRMYALILFVLAIVTCFNMAVYAYERRLARRRGA
ncbi:MAG: nitrate ABC transporter permease [Alphaproteobacteria bacterium 65-37]|jgi:NitT/TauT family transport system permease protein|nr:ABC transporter permease [Alphaproteobacteria bacterium]OJU38293.1 MAG: nitrate ABC transporter permease [Alphaproteobacteria bacterium 65-37]